MKRFNCDTEIRAMIVNSGAAFFRSMTPTVETSYVVSPRVTLTPGDRFKVAAGPYYRLAGGEKISMAARGTMVFVACHRRGKRVTIEARDGAGTVILHVGGRRRSPVPGMVPRPYKVTRKLKA
jgi:hypothetical protein